MFNNYRGFHLVEAHHNSRLAQWFHPNTVIKKSVQAVIVVCTQYPLAQPTTYRTLQGRGSGVAAI